MNCQRSILPSALALTLLAFAPDGWGQSTAKLTVLHNFAASATASQNEGGMYPLGLVQAGSGFGPTLYGVTIYGGANGNGTIYRLEPGGAFTSLHDFSANPGPNFTNAEGADPADALLQGSGDSGPFLYGTAEGGGPEDVGTVFQFYIENSQVVGVQGFDETTTGGYDPHGTLAQTANGDIYGVTEDGSGSNGEGNGTIFVLPADGGGYRTLHVFSKTTDNEPYINGDGAVPETGLILGHDGNLYGTTTAGGTSGYGTIFKITPAGTFTTLVNLVETAQSGNALGGAYTKITQGTDGDFYGTMAGGANGNGAFFKMTPAGGFTILYDFDAYNSSGLNNDGVSPRGVVEASDGNFYGVTEDKGPNGNGTFFKVTPTGEFTKLHDFAGASTIDDEGYDTAYVPIQAVDGFFYGTRLAGGANGTGTVYRVAVSPTITSADTALGMVGKAFSYQIAATFTPTSYGVQGLPAGFSVNAKTGVISATPNAAGKFTLTLHAYNAGGNGSATLVLTVESQPKITSAASATGTVNEAFAYQITASGEPTSFGVQGLPAGFAVNPQTGVISGTPKAAGKVSLTLNAYNAAGKGSAALTLTVQAAPPVITSAATATATVGQAFSYQVAATNQPTSFGVQGLPAGFTVDTKTGLLTGTPKAAGKVALTLNAYNAAGKGSAALTLTITAN